MKHLFECEVCGNTSYNEDFIKACELSHTEDMNCDIEAILHAMDEVEAQVQYLKDEYGDEAMEILANKMGDRLKSKITSVASKTAAKVKDAVKFPSAKDVSDIHVAFHSSVDESEKDSIMSMLKEIFNSKN